jgi:DNA-binding NtrC family response regulator
MPGGADKPTILVVDDDEVALGTHSRFLRLEGYHVVTASSADTGLAAAEASKPDAVLLDLRLPEVDDGLRVLQELRLRGYRMPIAIVTGHYDLDGTTEAAIHGLDASIAYKPLWLDDILSLVRSLLETG